MLKITPIKQQTGARFWPGDLGQPRAAGEAARATQQLTRTFQQGLNTIGQLVADQDRVSKAAHRNYVSGAIKSDIQDSLRHALVTAKPDGSNLFEIYDKNIGGKNLIERYTKDADDDEKKYLSGVISGEVARLRGGLLQPFLQRGTQQAEITITNMVNDNANEIRDSWHLSTFFKKFHEDIAHGKYDTGLYNNATEAIKPKVANTGITSYITRGIDALKDKALEDPTNKTAPTYQDWEELEIALKPELHVSDLSEEDMNAWLKSGYTGKGAWRKFVNDRVAAGKPVGYKDAQRFAGIPEHKILAPDQQVVVGLEQVINRERAQVNSLIAGRAAHAEKLENQRYQDIQKDHALEIYKKILSGNVTEAKKDIEKGLKGLSFAKDANGKLKHSQDDLDGRPLVDLSIMKTLNTEFFKVKDRETTKGFAKRLYDYTSAQNETQRGTALNNLDSYYSSKLKEGRFSPSNALKLNGILEKIKEAPKYKGHSAVKTQAVRAVFERYYTGKKAPTTEDLIAAINKSQKVLRIIDNVDQNQANRTAGGKALERESDTAIEQAKSLEGLLRDEFTNDTAKKIQSNNILKSYQNIILKLKENGIQLPMDGGHHYPDRFPWLEKLSAFSTKDIQGMEEKDRDWYANRLVDFARQFKRDINRHVKSKGASNMKQRQLLIDINNSLDSFQSSAQELANIYRTIEQTTPKVQPKPQIK